jgi:predicted transcriptional regulator
MTTAAPSVSTSELAVIGTLLTDHQTAINEKPIAALVKNAPDSFLDLRCGALAVAIRTAGDKGLVEIKRALGDKLAEIGGADFLAEAMQSELPLSLASAEAQTCLEAFERRQLRATFTEALEGIERSPEHYQHIAKVTARTLAGLVEETAKPEGLPLIMDASEFEAEPLPLPPELVKGLLHQGDKLAIGGGSKSFKTFALLDLALSVAYGLPWLGMETQQGVVCMLNFELRDWSIQRRLFAIEKAKGIVREPGRLHIWNLRGCAANYETLIPELTSRLRANKYALTILDPLYKLLGTADENSARDITALLNSLERLNQETRSAIAFGSHFSKGNQAGKESIDRISGSGVFARDPDSIMTLTKLAEEGTFAAEFTLRNLPPLAKFGVRWNYPLFFRDDALNPEDLKQVNSGKPKKYKAAKLLSAIINTTGENPISISAWAGEANVKRSTLRGYLPEFRTNGWIKTAGEGENAGQYITEKGKEVARSKAND